MVMLSMESWIKTHVASIQFTQQSQILNKSPERRIIGFYQNKGFAYIVHECMLSHFSCVQLFATHGL